MTAIPKKEYFDELKRISKTQIIWGGNYFLDYLEANWFVFSAFGTKNEWGQTQWLTLN